MLCWLRLSIFAIFFFGSPSIIEATLVSIKAAGMGLTGVAYPQDAESGALNPANMAFIGNRYDVGISAIHTEGVTLVHGNRNPSQNGKFISATLKNHYNPHFALNTSLFCDRASLGFVLYNRSLIYSQYNRNFPLLGTSKLHAKIIQEIFTGVFAYKIHPHHSIGVAFNIAYQVTNIAGLQNFANPLFSEFPNAVTNRGNDYSHGFGVSIGWLGHITPWLSLGAVYQPKIHMSRFRKYQGFIADRGKLDIPETFSFGVTLKPNPCSHICFDVQRILFGDIPALHNPLLPNLVTSKLGRKDGAALGWHSQTIYRLGLDYKINGYWTIRAGYRHAKIPYPKSATATNLAFVDVIKNVFTIGTTVFGWYGFEYSAFAAWGIQNIYKGKHSLPGLGDPINLGGGEVDLKQRRIVAGFGLGKQF